MQIKRTRVSAIIIRDKKILLVKGKQDFISKFYFTPGGKIEDGETDIAALNRELMEEISVIPIKINKYFDYLAKYWDGELMKVVCFFVDVETLNIKLSGEIGEMIWYSKGDFEKNVIPISEGMAMNLIPKLIEENYL